MITIADKSQCSGCTACAASCPVGCIDMRRDGQGFDYPYVDHDRCIRCGKCIEVCHGSNPSEPTLPLAAYALKNHEYLMYSSSGGAFMSLAVKVISEGGTVWGAAMTEDMTVRHSKASTLDELKSLCGAKYVQSDLRHAFKEVKASLTEGRSVLFTGTPCQIAGLNRYLGRKYDNLLTVDVACHGVPSPGLWKRYVEALKCKLGGKISEVRFRDKTRSWMHYDFTVKTDGCKRSVPYMDDPYMALFVQNLTLRPSCYSCPVRDGKSGSDMTLADMWTVAHVVEEMNDDKGTSLVAAYTEKGKQALRGIASREVDFARAIQGNGGFAAAVTVPDRREEFFQGYSQADDLITYMKGFMIRKSFCARTAGRIRFALYKMKRRLFR